ncbi:MAG: hypothetical protein M3O67_07655, partial [Bacteroidota bacterium]|nr:hypothetical protein [Bacteroidota bacterium]
MSDVKNIFDLGELFETVQMQKIFADGKTFVDCTPLSDLTTIKQKFEIQKNQPGFNLAAFVNKYFSLPKEYASGYKSVAGRPIR